jgi:hypothetical protein
MGMSFVRNHELDHDAQAVWRELVAHHTTPTAGMVAREALLTHLHTMKLDLSPRHGTHVAFLAHVQDKLREYERLTPVVDHYSSEMKLTLLQQAVSTVEKLE